MKPKNLLNYITYEEIEQIGFDYTEKPFPWSQLKSDEHNQFFKLRDGVHILQISIKSSYNCIIYSSYSEKEDSCHICFNGRVDTIGDLKDVLAFCLIPHSKREYFEK